MLGSKDATCSTQNLLTRGWDASNVQDVACPGGSGCGTTYSLDAARPSFINFTGGFFCPVSTGPSALTFTQAVTSPTAGTKFHLSLEIAGYSGFTGSSGCAQWGNTTFLVSLGGVGGASYTPAAGYITAPLTGCVAGNGTLDVDLNVPFAAGETKNLTFGMTPISFAAGSTGCGGYAESFTVTNAKLVKVQ